MQTEIVLSTAEAEYISLSTSLREVILFMYLLQELSEVIELHLLTPKMKCKIFEDNESCIVMARSNIFSPRTKHIALKYHHFRRFVEEKILSIEHIQTNEQTANILTKPIDDSTIFGYLIWKLFRWCSMRHPITREC